MDDREEAGIASSFDEDMMALLGDDYDWFLEMLERSDPQAFRELIERDRDRSRAQ